MTVSLKNNFTILNIFKDELLMAQEFIVYHSPLVKQIIMLNTGDNKTFDAITVFAKQYENVTVLFKEFDSVNFSDFRNACLANFKNDTLYYGWVDIDEQLHCIGDEQPFRTDIVALTRIDASNKFSTVLNRIFKSGTVGTWISPIHEHFSTESKNTSFAIRVSLFHKISEAKRSEEKRNLYFKILSQQLRTAKENNDRQNVINALQHLILMASIDFKNPAKCISLFEENAKTLISADTSFEISKIQKLNIFIHVIMSYARTKNKKAFTLVPEVFEIDTSKSTTFQLLRALAFDESNHQVVKECYENEYKKLQVEQTDVFNNADFSIPAEVKWFENKIGI